MTLRVCAKVLLHVWSYDLYDTTLSTEKYILMRAHNVKFKRKEKLFQIKHEFDIKKAKTQMV